MEFMLYTHIFQTVYNVKEFNKDMLNRYPTKFDFQMHFEDLK